MDKTETTNSVINQYFLTAGLNVASKIIFSDIRNFAIGFGRFNLLK